MAPSLKTVSKIKTELQELQFVNNGIWHVKTAGLQGGQMSAKGYLVMDVMHKSVRSKILKMQHDLEKLTNINLI